MNNNTNANANREELAAAYLQAITARDEADYALSQSRTANLESGLSQDFGNQGLIARLDEARERLDEITRQMLGL